MATNKYTDIEIKTAENLLKESLRKQYEMYDQVIRCKDCKFYRQEIDMCDEPYSTAHNVVHEDDFCSKAERKEE